MHCCPHLEKPIKLHLSARIPEDEPHERMKTYKITHSIENLLQQAPNGIQQSAKQAIKAIMMAARIVYDNRDRGIYVK
jgi:hypothetical protein